MLTFEKRRSAARQIARFLFPHGVVANLNRNDIQAAVAFIDDSFDTVINDIPVGQRVKTIKQLMTTNLPEPFKSASTAIQKAAVLQFWAVQEVS